MNPDAAASPRPGLAETLTVTPLKRHRSLLKTLMSTNPAESMIDIVWAHARNAMRWQDGTCAYVGRPTAWKPPPASSGA